MLMLLVKNCSNIQFSVLVYFDILSVSRLFRLTYDWLAARLVSWACRHDHITPVVTKLHWLPVHKRLMFKTVVLVWKCLNGIAPGYLKLCVPVVPVASASGRQHLRSASTGLLQVPRAQTTIGQRSFAVVRPFLWNSLSVAIRRPEMTLHTFLPLPLPSGVACYHHTLRPPVGPMRNPILNQMVVRIS